MSSATDTTIDVGFPERGKLVLRIRVGGCRLRIRRGDGDRWVTGTYHDPSGVLPCRVNEQGTQVEITQGVNLSGWSGLFSGTPLLDLALGVDRPYELILEGGASDNVLDLGGLPLTELKIRQGAGKYIIDFSTPNPIEMNELDIEGGAVGLEMRNLANANFLEMDVDGGASSYLFDFGGTLRQSAKVEISTGVSSVEIAIPTTTAAKVQIDSTLGSLDIGDGFTKRQGAFWTAAAESLSAPLLDIRTEVTVGQVRLRATPPVRSLPSS